SADVCSSDLGGLAHPRRAVGCQVADHFPAAHREADEHCVAQIEVLHQHLEIASEGVVVIPEGRLTRLAEAAAVAGDDSIAIGEELALLAFPRVAIEWIAMDQNDRAATAVVLIVNINWSAVLGADGDRSH